MSPAPVVAVVGGGQLGRMLALAGIPLGYRFRFLEPKDEPPAAAVGEVVQAPYDDPDGLEALVRGAEVVTYEFENVPVAAAGWLAERVPVRPPAAALRAAQDRLVEKETFRGLGIGTAPFRDVTDRDGLDEAVAEIGMPAVLKTRRMGYDGKGQVVIRGAPDVEDAWERLGQRGPFILEGFVAFQRELSILAVRSATGETRFYPVVENEHREGILVRSRVPVRRSSSGNRKREEENSSHTRERPEDGRARAEDIQERAEEIARRVLDHLDYAGVLAVELFDAEGGLLANEMAPRVHNSGHWTQDGAWTSQFENHVRAVLGLPLGPTAVRGPASAMINLLGSVPPRAEVTAIPGARLHLYDKAPRPGRKLGHVNVVGTTAAEVEAGVRRVDALLGG